MTTELKELKEDEAEMKAEEITYIRKKPNRKECHLNYDHLKQEVINVPAPEGFDICDICGSSMELKKYNERKELVYTPTSLVVRIYRTPVYECKKCQSDNADGKSTYKSVSGVKPLISGSLASASLVAHIMDMKYLKGLPLHAQQEAFLEHELILPKQNMVNWLSKAAEILKPLYV